MVVMRPQLVRAERDSTPHERKGRATGCRMLRDVHWLALPMPRTLPCMRKCVGVDGVWMRVVGVYGAHICVRTHVLCMFLGKSV